MSKVIGKVLSATEVYFDATYFPDGRITPTSHTQNTDTGLGTLGTKNPPIDADKVIYRNSASSDALVTSTWAQIKAFLKTYFDTLYRPAGNVIQTNLFGSTDNPATIPTISGVQAQIFRAKGNWINSDVAVETTISLTIDGNPVDAVNESLRNVSADITDKIPFALSYYLEGGGADGLEIAVTTSSGTVENVVIDIITTYI